MISTTQQQKVQGLVDGYIDAAPEIKDQKNIFLISPMINNAFSKNEILDKIIINQCLAHTIEDKINEMTKLETLKIYLKGTGRTPTVPHADAPYVGRQALFIY